MKKTKAKIPPLEEQRARIEYMELGVLLKFPKNPRGHDMDALGEAFEDRGFVTPVLMDETSGLLVEGHGRLEKLQALKDAKKPAPGRIEVRDGKWYLPVVRGIYFSDMDQARRHLLGANRIGENLYENKLLADMLGKLGNDGLMGTGFYESDVAKFMALIKDPWASDIAAVEKSGSHLEGIPGRITITCPIKKKDEIREVIEAAIKRRGFKGVEIA